MKRIEIPLSSGHKIVACLYDAGTPDDPDISVTIRDKDDLILQDIAHIMPASTVDGVKVLVYADENDEDFTHRFIIPEYQEEEEE